LIELHVLPAMRGVPWKLRQVEFDERQHLRVLVAENGSVNLAAVNISSMSAGLSNSSWM